MLAGSTPLPAVGPDLAVSRSGVFKEAKAL